MNRQHMNIYNHNYRGRLPKRIIKRKLSIYNYN